MSLTADELAEIKRWIKAARPLKGTYYRSVEYRFMNPDEVLNGRGAELYGGRFAENAFSYTSCPGAVTAISKPVTLGAKQK